MAVTPQGEDSTAMSQVRKLTEELEQMRRAQQQAREAEQAVRVTEVRSKEAQSIANLEEQMTAFRNGRQTEGRIEQATPESKEDTVGGRTLASLTKEIDDLKRDGRLAKMHRQEEDETRAKSQRFQSDMVNRTQQKSNEATVAALNEMKRSLSAISSRDVPREIGTETQGISPPPDETWQRTGEEQLVSCWEWEKNKTCTFGRTCIFQPCKSYWESQGTHVTRPRRGGGGASRGGKGGRDNGRGGKGGRSRERDGKGSRNDGGKGKGGKGGQRETKAGEEGICWGWLDKGHCRFGQDCKFYHSYPEVGGDTDNGSQHSMPPAASDAVGAGVPQVGP